MTHHAKLSPSASKRWMSCAGSVGLIEKLAPKETFNRYAAEGTVAHTIGEKSLLEGKPSVGYKGEKHEVDGFTFTVNDDMIEAVTEYVDYIEDTIGSADGEFQMEVEVWCSLESLGLPGLEGGTSDSILINREDKFIEVIDYKHGQGVAVEVEGNTQAMHYALGALIKLGVKPGDDWDIQMTIAQPRSHHPDGRIRSWGISSDALFTWQDDVLIPAVNLTYQDDAPFVPSDDGCRFCPVAGNCPALYEKTQELAIVDFTDDAFPSPITMTSEQKRIVMDHAAMLRGFIVAVENQIKLEVDEGSTDYENHYKLVRKTTHRKFIGDALDPDFSELLDHLDRDKIFVEKPLSMGAIEKNLKNALGVKMAKEIMGDLTTKPIGELVVAPIADKRKAELPSVVSDFDGLDD